MTPASLTSLGAFLGVALTVVGSVVVARIGARSNKEGTAQEAAFHMIQELQEEIKGVKQTIKDMAAREELLIRTLWAATTFIDRIGMWREAGCNKDRQPQPSEILHPHINMDLWRPKKQGDFPNDGQPYNVEKVEETPPPP